VKTLKSPHNQYIKRAKQLNNKKFRDREGLFLLEGIRLIDEAINANYPLEYALTVEGVEPDLIERLSQRCETFFVPRDLLLTVAETEHPQGVVAVAKQKEYSLNDVIDENGNGLLMVVDGVQDPGNLGTIIRTADAAGADGVVLTKNTVDPYNGKTVRSSMGSILRLKLIGEQCRSDLVDWLKTNGYLVVVGHVGAEKPYHEPDYSGRVAVVVGNENCGPSHEFKEAGCLVKIPCRTESLNVSIAAAILLYEKVRREYISDEGKIID
jgi:TrmH family RNA methyltransferase